MPKFKVGDKVSVEGKPYQYTVTEVIEIKDLSGERDQEFAYVLQYKNLTPWRGVVYLDKGLTLVRQPKFKVGDKVVNILASHISDGDIMEVLDIPSKGKEYYTVIDSYGAEVYYTQDKLVKVTQVLTWKREE